MAGTVIGMGVSKKTTDSKELEKENKKLAKANETANKEIETLKVELAKANEKIAELEKAKAE